MLLCFIINRISFLCIYIVLFIFPSPLFILPFYLCSVLLYDIISSVYISDLCLSQHILLCLYCSELRELSFYNYLLLKYLCSLIFILYLYIILEVHNYLLQAEISFYIISIDFLFCSLYFMAEINQWQLNGIQGRIKVGHCLTGYSFTPCIYWIMMLI